MNPLLSAVDDIVKKNIRHRTLALAAQIVAPIASVAAIAMAASIAALVREWDSSVRKVASAQRRSFLLLRSFAREFSNNSVKSVDGLRKFFDASKDRPREVVTVACFSLFMLIFVSILLFVPHEDIETAEREKKARKFSRM